MQYSATHSVCVDSAITACIAHVLHVQVAQLAQLLVRDREQAVAEAAGGARIQALDGGVPSWP